jgi:predicted Zn-dependent peptidase
MQQKSFYRVLFILLAAVLNFAQPLALADASTASAAKLQRETPLTGAVKAYEYALSNGLTVVLIPSERAPLVSVYHWVKGGSLHESPGITGIAHLFEHMMFRPLKAGEVPFWESAKKLGASVNANTRFESTVYTSSVESKNLFPLLKLESDRFKNFKVTKDLLDVERKAVWSEYSTKLDADPEVDRWFHVYTAGFAKHAYGWMIVGYREDLEKITAENCNDFFARVYKPNNVGLFISGPMDRLKVLAQVEKLYGDWKPGSTTALPAPYQHDGKAVLAEGKLEAKSRSVLVGFRIPTFAADNFASFGLLNHILFGSRNSLATKRLVHEKKLVSSADSFNFEYDNGMLKVDLALLPGTSQKTALEELLAIRGDFANLTDEQLAAYKREQRITLAEAVQRNEVLNEQVALHWGKYGSVSALSTALGGDTSISKSISKSDLLAIMDKYIVNENIVAVTNKGARASL